jgi:hypothetical protein
MKDNIISGGGAPDPRQRLRALEAMLEYVASDLKGSEFPGLCLAVEGARAYAEDLLLFLGPREESSDLSG